MKDFCYILDENNKPVLASIEEWARWENTTSRVVDLTNVFDRDGVQVISISTVFLGLNHNFSGGPPLLFETMIFTEFDGLNERQYRYATYQEAVEGHGEVVKEVFYWVQINRPDLIPLTRIDS